MKTTNNSEKRTLKNVVMLYLMTFVKLVLPLVTLPFLTRVFSEETYGVVTYVKACMVYIQILIDFGFIFSAVKDIVDAKNDKIKIGQIVSNTYFAKTILVFVSFVVMLVMCVTIPILKANFLFALLSFFAVAVTAYIADFLFRGIEKMQIITVIFLIARSFATIAIFIFIHSENDLLLIPIIDIAANFTTVLLGIYFRKKSGIFLQKTNLKNVIISIKDSFTCFMSSMASTVFSVLNTVVIGIVITDLKQVAYWGVCMQMISAIQGFCTPITNGIYPHMIRERSLKFIHKILLIIMPIVILGCIFCFVLAEFTLFVVGGKEYTVAADLFRCMLPIVFFCFPAQIYGWPTLGAIGLVKKTTLSTTFAACVQVLGVAVLILTNSLTIYSMALLKGFTEFAFMVVRMYFTYSNRKMFDENSMIVSGEENG